MPNGELQKAAFMELGECKGQTDLMFPTAEDKPAIAIAKAICAKCTVIEPCYDYAMDNRKEIGVLAGLTERERRAIIRKERRSKLNQTKSL